MSDTAFIFSKKAHPMSSAFAKSVNADFYKVSRYSLQKIFTIPAYRNYMVESTFAISYPAIRRKIFGGRSKIILRNNSNLFSEEPRRYFQGNALTRAYIKFLLRNVDGIIAVSEMVAADGEAKCRKHIGRKIPARVVYSFIDPARWEKARPNTKSNNFLHIGHIRHHKGIDILMETFDILAKARPDARLYLAGISENDLRRYNITKAANSVPLGFVADIEKYISKCAFYIATPRYEPGPTASLEAMAGGLIPIVNHMTGHKDHVSQVSKRLVIESLQPNEIAKKIVDITKTRNRPAMSRKSRKIALKYSRENQIAEFKRTFGELTR